MTVSTAAQQIPITAPQVARTFTDEKGNLTNPARIALQQIHGYVVNTARMIPTNAATASNVINLTLLPAQPTVTQYAEADTYGFVADANSSGPLNAKITTANGSLASIKVFKNNGAAQATSGDVSSGLHYLLTYVSSLDGGNGGFVLR